MIANKKIEKYSDAVFTILLVLLFVGCMILFFVFAIIKQLDSSLYSASGIATSAALYIQWRKEKK